MLHKSTFERSDAFFKTQHNNKGDLTIPRKQFLDENERFYSQNAYFSRKSAYREN